MLPALIFLALHERAGDVKSFKTEQSDYIAQETVTKPKSILI